MKVRIVKNRYLNALVLVMLVSAGAHMLILIYLALKTGDIYILNYFNILDLDILLPEFFKNNFSGNLASLIFTVSLYILILKWTEKES